MGILDYILLGLLLLWFVAVLAFFRRRKHAGKCIGCSGGGCGCCACKKDENVI